MMTRMRRGNLTVTDVFQKSMALSFLVGLLVRPAVVMAAAAVSFAAAGSAWIAVLSDSGIVPQPGSAVRRRRGRI